MTEWLARLIESDPQLAAVFTILLIAALVCLGVTALVTTSGASRNRARMEELCSRLDSLSKAENGSDNNNGDNGKNGGSVNGTA